MAISCVRSPRRSVKDPHIAVPWDLAIFFTRSRGTSRIFDSRGRLLAENNRDYQRCHIDPVRPDGSNGRNGVAFALVGSDGHIPSAQGNDLLDVPGLEAVSRFIPAVHGADVSPGDHSQFRKCGIGLQVNIETSDMGHIDDFTVILGELDRTFFGDRGTIPGRGAIQWSRRTLSSASVRATRNGSGVAGPRSSGIGLAFCYRRRRSAPCT